MKFGYFTLSDNDYADNTRTANELVEQIVEQALYADELGYHSAWIGEHHFNTLGVLSRPDIVLANIAGQTESIRLAPAVSVLPLHHPIAVAEQWASLDMLSGGRVDFAAGRGYDRREYLPFGVSFEDNQSIFEEGLEIVRNLWSTNERQGFQGQHWSFDDVRITPQPIQQPIPIYVASFSKPSIELAARLDCGLVVAPFAAAMSFGGLREVADLYRSTCATQGSAGGKLICSYFTHFADNAAEEQAARARQIRYYKECLLAAFPGDPATAPPSYRYFIEIVQRLETIAAADLTENSVLIGNSEQMIETLKKVEAAGFDEVILYFNIGLKNHTQVRDEMARFASEVAPHFEADRPRDASQPGTRQTAAPGLAQHA